MKTNPNRNRSKLRRRAECPDCGLTRFWVGEEFASHRRAGRPTSPPTPAGLGIMYSPRPTEFCGGTGRTIEDRFLR